MKAQTNDCGKHCILFVKRWKKKIAGTFSVNASASNSFKSALNSSASIAVLVKTAMEADAFALHSNAFGVVVSKSAFALIDSCCSTFLVTNYG